MTVEGFEPLQYPARTTEFVPSPPGGGLDAYNSDGPVNIKLRSPLLLVSIGRV